MNIRTLFTGAVTAASLLASAAYAEELSVATFVPPQHATNAILFDWFGKELDARSGGSLTMKLYPAGQLGAGPVQQYKRAVEGVADITFGLQAYTPALFPKTMLIIPPGKASNSQEGTERLLSVFDDHLADEYGDVRVLGVFTVAGAAWAANKDVSTMDGLSGAKMVPYAAMTSPIIEAMGATPVQMPVTEMYTGLSTGTIDAATVGFSNMTPPWNFWDASSHLVENVPVQFAVFFVVMNKERYIELSDEHRAIIDELAGETFSMKGAEAFTFVEDRAYGMLDGAEQMANVTRIKVSDDERAKMDAAVSTGLDAIFADYEGRGIADARAIYDAMNAD